MTMVFRDILDQITFGVVATLDENSYVDDVDVVDCGSSETEFIEAWEQNNMCLIPEDLKTFYSVMNGLLIKWRVNSVGCSIQVGILQINSVESLVQLFRNVMTGDVSTCDLEEEVDQYDSAGHRLPHFCEKIFELSSEETFGKVCLVFKNSDKRAVYEKPEIWFLDNALQWHFLAYSFRHYLRMLCFHLGISGWQYRFTRAGLAPDTKKSFSLFLPYLEGNQNVSSNEKQIVNKIDFPALFKNKVGEKRKTPGLGKHTKSNKNKQL